MRMLLWWPLPWLIPTYPSSFYMPPLPESPSWPHQAGVRRSCYVLPMEVLITWHCYFLLIHLLLDVSAWFIILAPEARIVTIETFTNLLNELDFQIHKTQTELNYIILKEFNFKNKNLSPSFQMVYLKKKRRKKRYFSRWGIMTESIEMPII